MDLRPSASRVALVAALALAACGHNTPFMEALQGGDLAGAKQLAGATDLRQRNSDGENALHVAARYGDAEVVAALLDRGADIHTATLANWTPLHFASFQGNHKVATLLLQRGADPNRRAKHGLTPLLLASMEGDEAMVEVLLAHGAAPSLAAEGGFTPLHRAMDVETARLLLEAGADTNAADAWGNTPDALAGVAGRDGVAELITTYRAKAAPAAAVPPEQPTQPALVSEAAAPQITTTRELDGAVIQSVAVPRMEGSGVQPHFVEILSQTAVDSASRVTHLKVVGAADIEALLGFEKQKDLLGCDSASCMAEIGGALGVDALLRIQLGKLGETFALSATLIHIAAATPVVRGTLRVAGPPDALLPAVEALVGGVLEPVRGALTP